MEVTDIIKEFDVKDLKGFDFYEICDLRFCFQCFVHITKCCQRNYEGDWNGIFHVFIQVADDQHLSGETIF